MDQSDEVEITGSCVDLGRKKNRVLVEVFAGDVNETVDPYISNAITSNCYHISGSGVPTASGITSGSKCFWVTKGVGLIEDAGLPSQRDFPQCHNGQFGFVVKLGKILTDATLGTNYLVRFKIRTDSNGVTDSVWSRVKISRQLSPPKVPTPTPTAISFSCNLKPQVARFNSYLWYTLYRSYNFTGGASAPGALLFYTNLNGSGSVAYNYEDYYLVDGVTYNYRLDVSETQYSANYTIPPFVSPAPPPVAATPVTCTATPPFFLPPSPGLGSCSIRLNYTNTGPGIGYQIGAQVNSGGWSKQVPAVTPSFFGCTTGTLAGGDCVISGLSNTNTYFFALRAGRGGFNPAVNEVGVWSNEQSCRPQ